MSRITLPVQVGKKYTRRDGEIVTITRIAQRLAEYADSICYAETGQVLLNKQPHHTDLVADFIEPAKAHVHAASMLLYAQDAAETDEPGLRWECKTTERGGWHAHSAIGPGWMLDVQYRRKTPAPVFIDINGHQVPEPMRVAPEKGTQYWVVDLTNYEGLGHEMAIANTKWGGDEADCRWFDRGLGHLTKEAAELHATALLSFTAVKP